MKYKVRFERWVEEGSCSLECTFHFADQESADRFLKKRNLEIKPSSTIAHVWHTLMDTTEETRARDEKAAKWLALEEHIQRISPGAQVPESKIQPQAVGEK